MRIIGIDTDESVRRMRLVFPYTSDDRWYDAQYYFIVALIFIVSVILLILNVDLENTGDKISAITLLLLLLTGACYAVYYKLTEKILSVMQVPYDREIIRKKLVSYAQKQNLKTKRSSSRTVQLVEKDTFIYNFDKTLVFIIQHNRVFFTVLRENTYVPVLHSHHRLRRELEWLFREK